MGGSSPRPRGCQASQRNKPYRCGAIFRADYGLNDDLTGAHTHIDRQAVRKSRISKCCVERRMWKARLKRVQETKAPK